jgi:uncharacterized protein
VARTANCVDATIVRRLKPQRGVITGWPFVGLPKNQLRARYFVGYYLKRQGYRVIPVNPREVEILGEKSCASQLDVPVPVDIVNVFRAPDALPAIAAEAVKIGAGNLWCQLW